MRREFIDDDLIQWQVYSSTGQFSLPDDGRLVFLCSTDRERRPRTIRYGEDLRDAQAAIVELSDEQLRELLAQSREIP